MSLDLSKLQCLQNLPGKIIARCPACAEAGGDKKGNHLVIYPAGQYGCAAYQGDELHRKRIMRLAGIAGGSKQGQAPTVITVVPHPDRERWLKTR